MLPNPAHVFRESFVELATENGEFESAGSEFALLASITSRWVHGPKRVAGEVASRSRGARPSRGQTRRNLATNTSDASASHQFPTLNECESWRRRDAGQLPEPVIAPDGGSADLPHLRHTLRLSVNDLLGKALSERHQQLEWASEPNLPPQQCPDHVSFLPQKADPRLRVSGHVQIGLADMPFFHAELLVLNHDRCLPLLMAGEGKVEGGIQSCRLTWLEDDWHSFQENLDGVRP